MYEPVADVLGVSWEDHEIDPDLACCCSDLCSADCPCVLRSSGFAYSPHKTLLRHSDTESSLPIFECWKDCTCSQSCRNRLVQFQSCPGLEVTDCGGKGLGVVATSEIPSGAFVTEYFGMHTNEDRDGEYLFELRERFGEREYVWRVDAERWGGIARFFNHSCQGNMEVVPVRVGHTVPRLAFFTTIRVPQNTELTFRYRSIPTARRPCLCGTPTCLGFF